MRYVIKNKRGDDLDAKKFPIGLVLVLILAFIVIMFLIKGSDVQDDTINSVCSLSGGKCKEFCLPQERGTLGLGCGSGSNKDLRFCCLPLNRDESDNAAGDAENGFDVLTINIADDEKSCKDKGSQVFECSDISIGLKVLVKNTGENDLYIYANPWIEEGNNKLWFDGNPELVASGESKYLIVELTNLEKGKSYEAYPAVKCLDENCKNTDSEGLFAKNDLNPIILYIKK